MIIDTTMRFGTLEHNTGLATMGRLNGIIRRGIQCVRGGNNQCSHPPPTTMGLEAVKAGRLWVKDVFSTLVSGAQGQGTPAPPGPQWGGAGVMPSLFEWRIHVLSALPREGQEREG